MHAIAAGHTREAVLEQLRVHPVAEVADVLELALEPSEVVVLRAL